MDKTDIKLMASQRLADTDDGGGQMTGIEVVDGNVNNLYPDISRLDRVYGRVSLRKAFLAVLTSDNATYYGAHIILTKPADDPLVHVCLFSTADPFDVRTSAQDRIESYVTQGVRYPGYLWGSHVQGSRALLFFQAVDTQTPEVGDVLYLVNNEGLASEVSQYVRVTSVESEVRQFTDAQGRSFTKLIVTVGIGDPLRETFGGAEISISSTVATASKIYDTLVADAAQYFGVMRLAQPVSGGALSVQVESIFTHLVPSAQAEAPVVDVGVGDAGPVVVSGAEVRRYTLTTATSISIADGVSLYFGRAIAPGTLAITDTAGYSWADNGAGILRDQSSNAEVGTVDYSTGAVRFVNPTTHNATVTMSAVVATATARVADTKTIYVDVNNRGYNYTATVFPPPAPKTLMVDYMAQGKWYRLRDNGGGSLVPDLENTGTGTINYATGSVILTCAALPDAGSAIMFSWGSPLETSNDASGTTVPVEVAQLKHTVAAGSINPGSLTISWLSGGGTVSATDNGTGALTGAGTGTVLYATGEIRMTPTTVPDSGAEYVIDYQKYTKIQHSATVSDIGGGLVQFTLPDLPVKPRSFSCQFEATGGGVSTIITLRDDGSGGVSSSQQIVQKAYNRQSGEITGTTLINGSSGTIDYNTGVVQINGLLSGTVTWRVPIYGREFTGISIENRIQGSTTYTEDLSGLVAPLASSLVLCNYTLTTAGAVTDQETLAAEAVVIDLTPASAGRYVVPGSVAFTWAGARYVDLSGTIFKNPSLEAGVGTMAGSIDYTTGLVTIDSYNGGTNAVAIKSLLTRFGSQFLVGARFRTPGAPLRPGSLYVQATTATGDLITGTADFSGAITGDRISGTVDVETGVVRLEFGELVVAAGNEAEPWYDQDQVDIDGNIWRPTAVFADTITYNCVVYSYLPLDADLIGIDPVRLPTDGRVPIVKDGNIIVIHNSATEIMPSPLTAGQVVAMPRTDLDLIELYDDEGTYVPTTLYTVDLAAGTVTMANPLDLTGYVQPLQALHRIEDMALVSDVQINGTLTLAATIGNAYPVDGTYVSSALLIGDLAGRVYGLFDQATWTNVWSDVLIGNACVANFNEVNFPIVTSNAGAIEERWALIFDSTTHFSVVGEHVGIIADGYITNTLAPLNPATGVPYFTVPLEGWGSGWASGNVLRFNTTAANAPVWLARTTLSGQVTEPTDQFTIQLRGDAD